MALLYRQIKNKFIEFIPLMLLFFTALNGNAIVTTQLFSFNFHYILIYFCVLRHPLSLGNGFIFLSGVISDVVYGLPLGASALTLLAIVAVAAYVRVVTVRISLINDWITFIPALLFANFIYFFSLYFSNYSIDYLYLFQNSMFTIIFYPVFWGLFSLILNLTKT